MKLTSVINLEQAILISDIS
uniref:Uncharacterized protein n=1 Tax=Arundo donax TaxID=35708 RepID=A0A0A9BSY6_ARUDO